MLNHILKKQIQEKEIFHSYIFEGSLEKTEDQYICFAEELYKTHIDVRNLIEVISPDGNTISIDSIRHLNRQVFERPANLSHKIYVIKEAHLMRVEAQNAMLKTLEELPAYSLVIMLTNNRYKLLDTIISRSQTISFNEEYNLDFSSDLFEEVESLLRKSLENNYYIINKDKDSIKKLTENRPESLRILSKIFSDAILIEDVLGPSSYIKLIDRLKKLSRKDLEEALLRLEEIKNLLKVNINFQLAMEDLIFFLIEANKKSNERSLKA